MAVSRKARKGRKVKSTSKLTWPGSVARLFIFRKTVIPVKIGFQ
jgi:hypothetical protein